MKKIIGSFFIIISVQLYAKVPVPCKTEEHILIEKGVDLDTKTLKSWVRLLNNKIKKDEFGITLTKAETIALIKCLTIEIQNRKLQGKIS
jgi:hypothetical protein